MIVCILVSGELYCFATACGSLNDAELNAACNVSSRSCRMSICRATESRYDGERKAKCCKRPSDRQTDRSLPYLCCTNEPQSTVATLRLLSVVTADETTLAHTSSVQTGCKNVCAVQPDSLTLNAVKTERSRLSKLH